ncbi:MAG TPA: carboxypeptidase-like regulatory domain-containing protein [Candidatus Baltobacteraceae bacterium]|nr:carboxypeptidase-like regulatory domain-containing protein [Candidatus Baltobacteraceae bacterium]
MSIVLCGALARSDAAEATTGVIAGTIVSGDTPVANARVSAASPSGRSTTTSDARGSFALLGVTPDTYVVSAQAIGYEPVSQSGVTVLPGQVNQIALTLIKELKTIASARATAEAFSAAGSGDVFTVTGRALSGPPVSASGLAAYTAARFKVRLPPCRASASIRSPMRYFAAEKPTMRCALRSWVRFV